MALLGTAVAVVLAPFVVSMLWAGIIFVTGALLAIVLIGFAIWFVGLFALGCWAIYRIASGWLRLNDGRAI